MENIEDRLNNLEIQLSNAMNLIKAQQREIMELKIKISHLQDSIERLEHDLIK